MDAGLVGCAARTGRVEVVAVPRNADVRGFQVLPRRWVVEGTFGWLTRCRRLARDDERKTIHVEAMVKFAMIRSWPPGWPAKNSPNLAVGWKGKPPAG